VPDFFIVGHAKSGTTALYEMLRRRPEIYMPELKETRFFAPDLKEARTFAVEPKTLDDYLALFAPAGAGQLLGEASPQYIRSQSAAALIAEVQPDARIIAILREPASFLHSLHLQLLQAHVETEPDLGEAIALEQSRRRQRLDGSASVAQGLMYLEHVRYVDQLRRFHSAFGREQVLVLIYDDFRADNQATVKTVLRFLGLDDSAPIEVTEANPTVQVRSPRLYGLVRSLYLGRGPVARAVKAPITALTPRRLRHGGLAMVRRAQWTEPDAPDEQLLLDLRRRFKGEVVALSEYLDRDLVTLWGYDDFG
jgi:hypothetical protein